MALRYSTKPLRTSTPSSSRTPGRSWLTLSALTSVLLLVLLPHSISSDRTKAKIYINLSTARGCFRRMNADGVVGCQSSFNGDVGVVHFIDAKIPDLDYVLKTGPTPPYVAVMKPDAFTRNNVVELFEGHARGRVNGIVVLGIDDPRNDAVDAGGYSPDAACPNKKFGLYGDEKECYEWNKPGSGLMLDSFPFPVFLIPNGTDLERLRDDCFDKFNDPKNNPAATYPLCGIELHSFMYGSVSSKRCLRRSTKMDISAGTHDQQVCDPLGDQNVFGFLRDPQSPPPSNSSVVMVTARLDSTSFFEEVYPGVDSPASGIVALLATAHTLKRVEDEIKNSSKNVLFTLFNGESFDYLGSNRVVYDMTSSSSSSWPISNASASPFVPVEFEHLSHFLELSQFSAADGDAYLFSDKSTSTESKSTEELVKTVLGVGTGVADLNVTEGGVDQLPPASLQQFLKGAKKQSVDLPGVLITEHKDHFANKYYNSFLDTSANIKDRKKLVENLARVATLTARSVLKLTTGKDDDELEANLEIVDDLVHCFIDDTNCTLFKMVMNDAQHVKTVNDKRMPFSYYVGVLRSPNMYRYLSRLILAHFIGDEETSISKKNCTGDLHNWMLLDGNASCVRAFVGTTEASSPAVHSIYDGNVLFSFDDEKANHSAVWTESVWSPNTLTARIFLIPSAKRQATVLIIGILEFLLFMVLMFFVNKKSDVLFDVDTSTQEVLTESTG